MDELDFEFIAPLWIYQGKGAWHFITVPEEQSGQIKFFTSPDISGRKRRGWGSVRVTVQIGEQVWQTSIFPSKSTGCYYLPVKKEIRKKTGIADGDKIDLRLTIKTGL